MNIIKFPVQKQLTPEERREIAREAAARAVRAIQQYINQPLPSQLTGGNKEKEEKGEGK